MSKDNSVYHLSKSAIACFALVITAHVQATAVKSLTFERAYEIAVASSPQAQLLEAQLEAVEGQVEQAQLRPNPTIGVELENVLGTGQLKGVDGAEFTFGISQLIERREKRERRAELARQSKNLYQWNYEEALAVLRFEVRQAFSQSLVAQQNVVLQKELLVLAEASQTEVARRASAANASSIEFSQAKFSTRRQSFEIARAEMSLAKVKMHLAVLLNYTDGEAFELVGSLALDESELPALATLVALLGDSPSLARFQAEKEMHQAAVELERVEAKGDVELFGGVKYLRESGDDAAFVVGIDIPWKIRNRNQGNIRSAMAELRVVESQRQLARRDAVAALSISYRELSGALEEWKGLSSELLPFAEAVLEETQTGYEQGIITLLNVLEARKALFEIRSEMLTATQRYLTAQTEIEMLTASNL